MSNCDKSMTYEECELAILRSAVDKAQDIKGYITTNSREIKDIISVVEEFIISKQLIAYGGTAINNILPEHAQFYDKKKAKDRRGITIYQNNEKVQSAYYDYKNNKRIGDKPSAIVGTKLGSNEPSYDFTPVSEFQLEKFKDFSESLKNYWSNGEEAKSKAVEVEEEAMPF